MPGGGSASAGAALAEAKSAHQSGDLRKADRLYRRILARDPDCAPALNLYGILASQRGDPGRAVQRLRRAVAIDGDTTDYRINLGVVLETAGDWDGAFDCYIAALTKAPRHADLLARLPEAAQRSDRYAEFADTLANVCAAAPDHAEAHFLRGMALNFLRRQEEAVAAFERAAVLAPAAVQVHANLASTQMDLGRPEAALAACETCLSLDPRDSFALATKAIALGELGDRKALRPLVDFDELLDIRMIEVPSGYADIAAFNDALEAAVLSHPSLRRDPNHRSCHFADQTDDLFLDAGEPFTALEATIRAAAEDYCRKLSPTAAHPFLANPAPRTALVGWATVMRAQGHQSAHIHPTSWLSAVYYVRVPDLVRRGDNSHKGWIEFGRPPDHYPVTKEPDIAFFEPVEGKLILFPSYLYHRTVPYEDDAMRISIACDFDVTLAR